MVSVDVVGARRRIRGSLVSRIRDSLALTLTTAVLFGMSGLCTVLDVPDLETAVRASMDNLRFDPRDALNVARPWRILGWCVSAVATDECRLALGTGVQPRILDAL